MPLSRRQAATYEGLWYDEGVELMGARAKGKDKGKSKKRPKTIKPGIRPHELQQQARTVTGPSAGLRPSAADDDQP